MRKILKDFNIFIKLIVIIFVGISSIFNGSEPIVVVALLLIIFCLSLISYIVPKRFMGVVLLSAVLVSIILGINYSGASIILAAYGLAEYLSIYKGYFYSVSAIIPLSIFFIYKDTNLIEYSLIILLICFIQGYIGKANKRINYLEFESDERRVQISKLNQKLKEIEKYREQEFITFKLKERNELSGKMHDKIGHTLAGSLLQLEALKIVIGSENNQAIDILDNTTKVIRNGMNDIRVTLREIKPSFEQLGISKIKLLLEEKINNTDFSYNLISNGNIETVNQSQWNIIIEGIRELSTNSIKYSKGKKINIEVSVLKSFIKIEFNDDGVGELKIKKGMGLNSIEERLLEQNGKLILDGSKGFSAIMLLPIEGV